MLIFSSWYSFLSPAILVTRYKAIHSSKARIGMVYSLCHTKNDISNVLAFTVLFGFAWLQWKLSWFMLDVYKGSFLYCYVVV